MVLGPPKIVVSPPETKENKLYLKLANNMYSSRINQRISQEKYPSQLNIAVVLTQYLPFIKYYKNYMVRFCDF